MVRVSRRGNQFELGVGVWTRQMKDYTKAVWQGSVIELVRVMQLPVSAGGNMPVRSGFLRASLRASTASMPVAALVNPNPRGSFGWDDSEIVSVVKNSRVGGSIYLGYTAVYAQIAEYKWGYGFQRLAVLRWPTIVEQVANQLRAA